LGVAAATHFPPGADSITTMTTPEQTSEVRTHFTRESILEDYRTAFRSRPRHDRI